MGGGGLRARARFIRPRGTESTSRILVGSDRQSRRCPSGSRLEKKVGRRVLTARVGFRDAESGFGGALSARTLNHRTKMARGDPRKNGLDQVKSSEADRGIRIRRLSGRSPHGETLACC